MSGPNTLTPCCWPTKLPSSTDFSKNCLTNVLIISLKLDSWVNSPNRRLKDKADVIELVKGLKLPRDLAVDEPVRHLYTETWDALQAEQ